MGSKINKTAIITGITGQDGSYLAELLIKKKYKVYGLIRVNKDKNRFWRIDAVKNKIKLLNTDINNYDKISKIIKVIKPDEFYHLAAQSFINYNFEDEFFRLNPNINGTHYILSALKDYSPKTKFYFAASSEIFGNTTSNSQNENTPFNPRSAYGISKVTGFLLTKNYREAYGLFSCSGILFNHESSRRSGSFVTKKIIKGLIDIKKGNIKHLRLGNLNAKRDWGHAKDYVIAMWKMLQQKQASDFVIGTGKLHSVKDFLQIASKKLDLDYKKYIIIDKKYWRKNDKFSLKANPSKAHKKLKWKPKTKFRELINDMIKSELELSK
jgi:GDPmannose 4,6-dehydratase